MPAVCRWNRSDLVEAEDVNGLYLVFPLLKHGDDVVVDRTLFILTNETDNQLEDAVCDWLLLKLSLPYKTIHLNGDDPSCERIKISLVITRFHLDQHDRFGNNCGLLFLGSFSLFLCCECGSCSLTGIIVTEEIVFVDFVRWGSSSFGGLSSLLLSGSWAWEVTCSPLRRDTLSELADDSIPGIEVRCSCGVG